MKIFCLFNKLGDIASVPLVQSLFYYFFHRLRIHIPPTFLQHEWKEDHVESEGNQLQLRTSGPVFKEVRHLEQQEFPNFATRSLPQIFTPKAHFLKGFSRLLLDVSVRLWTLSPVSRGVEVRLLVVRVRVSLGTMLVSLIAPLVAFSAFLLIALFIILVTMTAAGFEGLLQGDFFFVGFFSLLTSPRGFLFLFLFFVFVIRGGVFIRGGVIGAIVIIGATVVRGVVVRGIITRGRVLIRIGIIARVRYRIMRRSSDFLGETRRRGWVVVGGGRSEGLQERICG